LADRQVRGVFIGELLTASGDCTLAVYGLGSCVALILFDPSAGAGGLAHVLLPGTKPPTDSTTDLPAKYAADALAALQAGLAALGSDPKRLRAALVGGARLFQAEADMDRGVGQRNAESLKALLAQRAIPLSADETGGDQGRTVFFDLPECGLRVRTLRAGWRKIDLGDQKGPDDPVRHFPGGKG
jgi:chemotaxis protein CheD